MKRAIADTESVLPKKYQLSANMILGLTMGFCVLVVLVVYQRAGLL